MYTPSEEIHYFIINRGHRRRRDDCREKAAIWTAFRIGVDALRSIKGLIRTQCILSWETYGEEKMKIKTKTLKPITFLGWKRNINSNASHVCLFKLAFVRSWCTLYALPIYDNMVIYNYQARWYNNNTLSIISFSKLKRFNFFAWKFVREILCR